MFEIGVTSALYISTGVQTSFEKLSYAIFVVTKKTERGNVDVLNACKYFRENGKISDNLVIIVDKMYLKKSLQYCKENLVGCDEERVLFEGTVLFLIEGLQKSVPIVVKGYPITANCGEWLAQATAS